MIQQQIDKITEAMLEQLCHDKAPEGRTLDYKRELPGSTDKAKHEFLKDVCAFANAQGGDLVYGIDEDDNGQARAILAITTELEDDAIRRLRQLIETCVEPSIPGLRIHPVPIQTAGYVLVVRVPQSLSGPHRFVFQNHSKFPIRNERNSNDMSYDQLQTAFGRTATLAERAHLFHEKRSAKIANGQTWKPIAHGPIATVQLTPISSMEPRTTIDMPVLSARFNDLRPPGWGGAGRIYNLEGLLVFEGGSGNRLANYVQVHRNGALEYVSATWDFTDMQGNRWITSLQLAQFFRAATETALSVACNAGLKGAALLRLSLLRIGNRGLRVGQIYNIHHPAVSDRQDLSLPETWIEDVESADLDATVRPLLDVLWQGFGLPACTVYREELWDPAHAAKIP